MAELHELPTEEELLKLSRRGIVAYAARAARRVQPLFQADEKHGITQEHVAAVDNAIRLAERFVSVAHPVMGDAEFRVADAVNAVHAAAARADAVPGPFDAARAADAVLSAAYAAVHGADADAAYSATAAAITADSTADSAAGTRRDYETLLRLHHEPAPKLGKVIDLAQLGPLWPDGEPDWYRTAVERLQRTVTAGVSPPLPEPPAVSPPWLVLAWNPELVTEDEYMRLVASLGDLVRDKGGAGIERLRELGFTVEVPAGVLQ